MKSLITKTTYRFGITAVLAFGLLILFLVASDPRHLPLIILLVPFILLFVFLYSTLRAGLEILAPQRLKMNYKRIIAFILGLEPVLLLLLASINQLTLRDGILSIIFISGLAWYLSRLSFKV